MWAETCEFCGRGIAMMCQQGTGYCSLNCEDADIEALAIVCRWKDVHAV